MQGGQHGSDPHGLRSQTGVNTWDRCDRYASKSNKIRGPRGDGLRTAQTASTGCKATIKAVDAPPYGQVCQQSNQNTWRNNARKLQSQDRGRGAQRKGENKWYTGISPVDTKLERSLTARSSWGQVQQDKNVESKRNSKWLKRQHGTVIAGSKGCSQRETGHPQRGTIDGRNI